MIWDKIGSSGLCHRPRTPRPPAGALVEPRRDAPPRGELLMRNMTPVIALGLALVAGPTAWADTVDVSSTTPHHR